MRHVDYRCDHRVAHVTLRRPPVNVLDRATIAELEQALALAEADGASVLVLQSSDPRTFSAGVAVQDHSADVVAETMQAFHRLFRRLYRAPFVSIAKVRGRCLGGGCELALFCDLVIASDTAEFALPEIALACFPPVAVSAFPYRFGRAAMELIVTGDAVPAIVALRAGLVSRYVPRDEIDEHVESLAAGLAAKSAPALRLTVQTTRRLWSPGFEKALDDAERTYLEQLPALADYGEGMRAFLEKRPPRFEQDTVDERGDMR
ncbi:MAG: putative enoyl-CoA hydratase echA8 [Planctomycetes bacterium]|nr:putative enoyl-CoA hydratase echA8 [Planctomycetota bacterium]